MLKLSSSSRVVLGQSRPERDDRRARAILRWGHPDNPARPQPNATIDTPLPQRVQTALSYRVNEALQRRLHGGPAPAPASRKAAMQVVQATVDLDATGMTCIKILDSFEDE